MGSSATWVLSGFYTESLFPRFLEGWKTWIQLFFFFYSITSNIVDLKPHCGTKSETSLTSQPVSIFLCIKQRRFKAEQKQNISMTFVAVRAFFCSCFCFLIFERGEAVSVKVKVLFYFILLLLLLFIIYFFLCVFFFL